MAFLKFNEFRNRFLNESEANPHAPATRPAIGGGAVDDQKRVSVRIRYAKAGFDQKVINERLKTVGGIEILKSNIESGETIELHIDFPTQAKFEEFRRMHEAQIVSEGKVSFELMEEAKTVVESTQAELEGEVSRVFSRPVKLKKVDKAPSAVVPGPAVGLGAKVWVTSRRGSTVRTTTSYVQHPDLGIFLVQPVNEQRVGAALDETSRKRMAASKEAAKALYAVGQIARMGPEIGPNERKMVDDIMKRLDNLVESLRKQIDSWHEELEDIISDPMMESSKHGDLVTESSRDELNDLAARLVGDGKRPNFYFVGKVGKVELITTNGDLAYSHWKSLSKPGVETMMEDRLNGSISSQLKDDETGKIVLIDDYGSSSLIESSHHEQPVYKVEFAMGGSMKRTEFRDLLRKVVDGDKAAFEKIQGEVDVINSGHSHGQPSHKLSIAMGGSLSEEEFEELLVKVLNDGDESAFEKIQGEVDTID